MPSRSSSHTAGGSENRADYQAAFLRKVHRLLQLGYESLADGDYQNAEEDEITGDICKHLKVLTEESPTEPWMGRFSVHDQDPSNDVIRKETGKVRKGKRRPKIDLRLVSKQRLPNLSYWVEAKRLYRSDSVSEYTGDEGVGAFVCGEYAKDDEYGGMIAYVQTETVTNWVPKIEAKLGSGLKADMLERGRPWKSITFPQGPEVCFFSQHQRDDGRDITLYHVMFPFSL